VVDIDNGPAVRLYARHGFADTDEPADHPAEKRMLRMNGEP
jgi:ribosomal protein S18 acetylase RimI-like enzyme